jgi:hypothetical protein
MKTVAAVAAAFFVMSLTALAQQALPGCKGPTKVATGPNGKTLTMCLDGKYTTCLRDSQRLGHSRAAAKQFCDGRKAAGAVK